MGALGKFQGHGPSVKRPTSEIDRAAKDRVEQQQQQREANVDLKEQKTKKTKNEKNEKKKITGNTSSVHKIGEQEAVGTDAKTHGQGQGGGGAAAAKKDPGTTYGNIVFVRSRMFYARPVCNNTGHIRFGLRHIRMFTLCSLTLFLYIRFVYILSRHRRSQPHPAQRRWSA